VRLSEPPDSVRPQNPPGVQLLPHEFAQLLLSESLIPHDRPELRELFVPSDSEVPLDDDRPALSDCDRDVLCDALSDRDSEVLWETPSDSDTLSLPERTSRITSVSPISLLT
jgi:hypothetical protein